MNNRTQARFSIERLEKRHLLAPVILTNTGPGSLETDDDGFVVKMDVSALAVPESDNRCVTNSQRQEAEMIYEFEEETDIHFYIDRFYDYQPPSQIDGRALSGIGPQYSNSMRVWRVSPSNELLELIWRDSGRLVGNEFSDETLPISELKSKSFPRKSVPLSLPPGYYRFDVYIAAEARAGHSNCTYSYGTGMAMHTNTRVQMDVHSRSDLKASSLEIASSAGDLSFEYEVRESALENAVTIGVYWASGERVEDISYQVMEMQSATSIGTFSGAVPHELLIDAPEGTTHLLLVADKEDQLFETDEGNNVLSLPYFDIKAKEISYDRVQGGLRFAYEVIGSALPEPYLIRVYWSTSADLSGLSGVAAEFYSETAVGVYDDPIVNRIKSLDQLTAPLGTTHVLLVVNPGSLKPEFDSTNNVESVADVSVIYGSKHSPTDFSIEVIKEALRYAGQPKGIISSGIRSFREQARVMYDNASRESFAMKAKELETIKNPKSPSCATVPENFDDLSDALKAGYCLYGELGDSALDLFEKNGGDTVIDAMAERIRLGKPRYPNQLRHVGDQLDEQVYDIAPSSFVDYSNGLYTNSDNGLFEEAMQLLFSRKRISRPYSPNSEPADPGYHFVIPQPNVVGSQINRSTLGLTAIPPSPAEHGEAEQVETLSFGKGYGIAAASVSGGHKSFAFEAEGGDLVSAFVEVTSFRAGSEREDDDTVLYLIDPEGMLIASNDDPDPFEFDSQSAIGSYRISKSGFYEAVVTTYPNEPILDDGRVVGWTNDGGGDVDFELLVSTLSNEDWSSVHDVNFNGETTPLDALLVINALGRAGTDTINLGIESEFNLPPFPDVNRDGNVSPLDALLIVNELGRIPAAAAEGELVGFHTNENFNSQDHDEDQIRPEIQSNPVRPLPLIEGAALLDYDDQLLQDLAYVRRRNEIGPSAIEQISVELDMGLLEELLP